MTSVVVIALAAGMSLVALASPSSAATVTFTVNSALVGTGTTTTGTAAANNDNDTNAGDGTCQSYAGVQAGTNLCTLKAAIEEANAEYAADNSKTFNISFAPSVQGTSTAPTIMPWYVGGAPTFMTTDLLDGQDTNAVYKITSPVTLDLTGMQFGDASNDTSGVWFDLAGPNITLENFWGGIYTGDTSVVVAWNATNVTITNGVWNPSKYWPERFLSIQTGANGVNVSNVSLHGGYAYGNAYQALGGYINFTNSYTGASTSQSGTGATFGSGFSNITLGPNIQITQDQTVVGLPASCGPSSNVGCTNSIIGFDAPTAWDNEPVGSTAGTGTNAVPNAYNKYGFTNFTFTGNVVNGLAAADSGLCFASNDGGLYTVGPSSNFTITNNVFTNVIGDSVSGGCNSNNTAYGAGLIVLPRFLSGANVISGNVFQSVATSTAYMNDAIRYFGNAKTVNNTTGSGLSITNNYFDGWQGGAAVSLTDAGVVTVENNTFGSKNASQTASSGTTEEYQNGTGASVANSVLFNNFSLTAASGYATAQKTTNQSVRAWYPSAVPTVLNAPAPSSNIPVATPTALASMETCSVSLPVAQSTATNNGTQPTQGAPVNVGVYWTAANDAEVFLGYAQNTSGTSATLTVPLPIGAIGLPMTGTTQITGSTQLPAPAAFSAGNATIVNASTGALSGSLRLQTQVAANGSQGLAQNESSQYSRWVALSGTCSPALTISQNATYDGTPADGSPTDGSGAPQTYSSMTRARVFTVTSSMPLDPTTFTPSDITLNGSTATNARVVSVTPVDGSNDTQFTVVTEADDSGTIQINLPANTVAAPGGLTNQAAAAVSSTTLGSGSSQPANTLVYQNPLTVSPTEFGVVVGSTTGQNYTLSLLPGAPDPTANLDFTAALPSTNPYPLTLDDSSPTLILGTSSVQVNVQAVNDSVTVPAGGLVNTVTNSVSSADPNYDGLIVGSVTPTVYAVDPYLTIQKMAYTGVTGANTAANIEATGTQQASGGSLTNGTPVWFVFHVCNISATTASAANDPSWVTTLTNVAVTDDVLGTIATIPTLAAGTATTPNCTDVVYASNPVAISPTE